jgi:hypothetical protein
MTTPIFIEVLREIASELDFDPRHVLEEMVNDSAVHVAMRMRALALSRYSPFCSNEPSSRLSSGGRTLATFIF